jgi:hypothetical protein
MYFLCHWFTYWGRPHPVCKGCIIRETSHYLTLKQKKMNLGNNFWNSPTAKLHFSIVIDGLPASSGYLQDRVLCGREPVSCEVLGSHGGEYENDLCCAVLSGRNWLTFQWWLMPPSGQLGNVSQFLPHYTAQHPRRQSYSKMMFWVVTPCRLVGRYHRFGETYCLHLQGTSPSKVELSCDTNCYHINVKFI